MKNFLSFFMMMILFGIINAQTTIFSENMGTGATSNPTCTSYAGFQNYGTLTFTGTADVRNNNTSTGYTGASGNNNVFFTNTVGRYFTISGINTSDYTDLGLSFGLFKSTAGVATSSDLLVEVATDYNTSTNTGTFTTLSFSNVTGTANSWSFVTINGGTIPSSPTLAIRFTQTQTTIQFRVDDMKLTGTLAAAADECNILEAMEESAWATGGANYNNREVTDSYGKWSVSAITNMDASDRYTGARSVRLRANATADQTNENRVEMLFDHPDGIKTVSFLYASYGTHSGGIIHLEYSTNQGTTWIDAGSVTAPAWGTAMLEASFTLNISGNVRIKIYKEYASGNHSVNIDEICITSMGASPAVSNPTFSPVGATYVKAQNVEINCPTPGAQIYYTDDGSTPDATKTLYTAAIPLTTDGTYTFKAIAIKAGMDDSEVISATYTIHLPEPFVCDFLEDFETLVSGAGAYTGADVTFGSGIWRVVGYTTMDASDRYNGARSIRLRGNTTDSCHVRMLFDRPEGIGRLTFRYGTYGTHSGGQISSYYSTDHGATWTLIGSFNALSWTAGGSIFQTVNYNVNIEGDIRIKIARDGTLATNSTVNIDDICMTDYVSNVVGVPQFPLASGILLTPTPITITCSTPGADIYYTTNGDTPTTGATKYTAPFTVSATTTVKAFAVKAGMDDSPVNSATYTFPIEVPNIAAFKATTTVTSPVVYKITGDVTFVHATGRYFYVKDATGGLLIYDNATPVITKTYNNGDLISGGVLGTCTLYNGLYELIPVADLAAGTPGTPVQPIPLTMATLLANFATYESQLVKLEEVTLADGTFAATGAAANINMSQGSSQMVCRNHFGTITDYTTIATTRYNVTGFPIPFNTDRQLAPRNVNDIQRVEYTVTLNASPAAGGTPTGGGTYFYGDQVTINANTNIAYNFINWTEGATTITTNPYQFTATANRTLTANYQMKTYTITASVSDINGTISSPGATTVNYGADKTYTFTPNSGYAIDQVLVNSVNNVEAVENGFYTFTNVISNQTIVVSFKIGTYTLTLDATPGTVTTSSIPVTYGSQIGTALVNATPPAGCEFTGWFIDGTQIYQSTSWNYSQSKTAVAAYTYGVTVQSTGPGTYTPMGVAPTPNTIQYAKNATPTYTFTPNADSYIVSVFVDGVSKFTGNSELYETFPYTFSAINAAHTIQVTFAKRQYAANPSNSAGTGATIVMSPNPVQHGSNVTFTFVADCADITGITIDGVPYGPPYTPYVMNATGPLPVIVVTTQQPNYTMTATPAQDVDPMGYITPAGINVPVDCGETITYHFVTTDPKYRVKTLTVDGASVTPVPVSQSYTFDNIHKSHVINLEFEEFPYYVISFGPSAGQNQGGVVYPTLIHDAEYYVTVDSGKNEFAFTIVPDEGYEIDKVLVDNMVNQLAATTGTYTFYNVMYDHSIFATFKPIMYTITATADANGSIMPGGAVQVAYGKNQTFNTAPNAGYQLDKILIDGVENPTASADGFYTFENVLKDYTISATFTKKSYKITTITGVNGTITPANPSVLHGSNQTFTFQPSAGYEVEKVLVDGVVMGPLTNYTFVNVTQTHTIEVIFIKAKFTITATFSGGGEGSFITPSGIATVEYNAHSEIYVFVSDIGYHVKDLFIDGVSAPDVIEDGMYRFMDVKANHTIYVVFAKDNFTITATATAGGVISPAGTATVPNGSGKTYFFRTNLGYKLMRVIINGINNDDAVALGTYAFENVSQDHTIEAQFEKVLYNVTYEEVLGALVVPIDGSVSPVEYGGKYKFQVDIQEGYTQSHIIVRANNLIINPSGDFYLINNIAADQHITISGITPNQYKITAKAYNGGTITPAGTFMVEHGGSINFEMTPNTNYTVSNVLVNGESVGDPTSYLFADVRNDGKIEVYFKNNVGIEITDEAAINVFSHQNIVTIVNEALIPVKQVEIMDMFGRVVWTGQTTDVKTEITLDVAKGIYAVRIISSEHNPITTKVIIN